MTRSARAGGGGVRFVGRYAGVAAVIVMALSSLVAPAPALAAPPRVPGVFFGMHDTRLGSGGVPEGTAGSGRGWDVGCMWRDVEPARGRWAFGCLDRAVATARKHGARPLVVLGQTPVWAAA